jgi:hypothetical protein
MLDGGLRERKKKNSDANLVPELLPSFVLLSLPHHRTKNYLFLRMYFFAAA